jgi:hypothetical protein
MVYLSLIISCNNVIIQAVRQIHVRYIYISKIDYNNNKIIKSIIFCDVTS